MKYSDTIQILKTIVNAIGDPTIITDKLRISEIFQFSNSVESNDSMNNNVYSEPENRNIEYNKSVPMEDNKSYNDNKSSGYYYEQQDTSSDSKGVIDSITQEITPVRLQQAIILSEIVGKPRSKTRKKRRF